MWQPGMRWPEHWRLRGVREAPDALPPTPRQHCTAEAFKNGSTSAALRPSQPAKDCWRAGIEGAFIALQNASLHHGFGFSLSLRHMGVQSGLLSQGCPLLNTGF